MKKVKITIAALAFVLTAGATFAVQNSNASVSKLDPNCTSEPNSTELDVTSPTDCPSTGRICCYAPGTSTPVDFIQL